MQAAAEVLPPQSQFLRGAARCLQDMPPIMGFAVMHQLNELKCDVPGLTAERARKFIDGVVAALHLFVPPLEVDNVREALLREHRRAYSPFPIR